MEVVGCAVGCVGCGVGCVGRAVGGGVRSCAAVTCKQNATANRHNSVLVEKLSIS